MGLHVRHISPALYLYGDCTLPSHHTLHTLHAHTHCRLHATPFHTSAQILFATLPLFPTITDFSLYTHRNSSIYISPLFGSYWITQRSVHSLQCPAPLLDHCATHCPHSGLHTHIFPPPWRITTCAQPGSATPMSPPLSLHTVAFLLMPALHTLPPAFSSRYLPTLSCLYYTVNIAPRCYPVPLVLEPLYTR